MAASAFNPRVTRVNNLARFSPESQGAIAVSRVAQLAEFLNPVEALNQRYAWIENPPGIWRIEHRDFIDARDFRLALANREYEHEDSRGRTIRMPLAEAWLKSPERRTHAGIVFAPGQPVVVGKKLNTWGGWGVRPEAGPVSPFVELVDLLFEGAADAKRWFIQWLAAPIQSPGLKLSTACILWSTHQGVGKSLLAGTIASIHGEHARVIGTEDLVSPFNGYLVDTTLIIGEEIGCERGANVGKIKNLVTAERFELNIKYQPTRSAENKANLLLLTNDPAPFQIEGYDRRFFVHECRCLPREPAFYDRVAHWLYEEGGVAAVMAYLQQVDLTGFQPHGHAPVTAAKSEMIDASRSDLERWLLDIADDEAHDEIYSLDDLVRRYGAERALSVSTTAVAKALRRLGMPRCDSRPRVQGRRPTLFALRRTDFWRSQPAEAWATTYENSLLRTPVGTRTAAGQMRFASRVSN
ncbi:MAG: primase-helicase family protein [Rhodospirillaceae bacterium]